MNEQTPNSNVPQRPQFDINNLKGVCSRRWRESLSRVENNLGLAQRSMQNYLSHYNEEYRNVNELLQQRQAVTTSMDTMSTFDAIAAHLQGLIDAGKYQSFATTSTDFMGMTTPIQITYDDVTYALGAYKVRISDSGDVNISSVTPTARLNNRYSGYCHPHVNDMGRPCLGNIAAEVPKMIGDNNYGVLMEVMYDYLCSYNRASPYASISNFPRLNDPTPVVVEAPVVVARPVEPTTVRPANTVGGFMDFVRQVGAAPRVTTNAPVNEGVINDPISEGPVYISARADAGFRIQGLDPATFTRHQLRKCRILATCSEAVFAHKMSYYVNWVGKTNRAAQALAAVPASQVRASMASAIAAPSDGTVYISQEIDVRFRQRGLEPALFSRHQLAKCRGLLTCPAEKFERRLTYYVNWVTKYQRLELATQATPNS